MPQFQYKRQQFQQDAVDAVVDVFRGVDIGQFQQQSMFNLSQPPSLVAGTTGNGLRGDSAADATAGVGGRQTPLAFMRAYYDDALDKNLRDIQQRNGIILSSLRADGNYLALDTQMETGTGKTFVFINTIFELHKRYQLTHFVVIVPSIAIKENAKKSFDTTRAYFERLYQQRIKVCEMKPSKSKKGRKPLPSGVMDFVHSQQLTVLIMTNHAFNSRNNLINQELEGFYTDNARTPMDAIAAKHPVLIIDEPQRVEGDETRARLRNFNPLFALRYSATFREGQIENLVYVLDAYDAFNKKLVKGVTVTDYQVGATDGDFLGVSNIRMSGGQLEAELEAADKDGGLRRVRTRVENNGGEGKLFAQTNNAVYRGLRVTKIDRRDNIVEFSNGARLKVGEYIGRDDDNERIIAEVMLRDTIEKHLEKESRLFARGIKCLSLIFIDRVKNYRDYDASGSDYLPDLFERCYQDIVRKRIESGGLSPSYRRHLEQWRASDAHGGYFSGDARHNGNIDAGVAERNNDTARALQQEISDLILRDKEKILRMNNKLRFIFAHSALREGWDNPNVFQICKLRTGYSPTGIVQEVGRGLRICVNDELERQDESVVGGDFSAINRLDVFTLGNGDFIRRLQQELSERRSTAKTETTLLSPELLRDLYNINIPQANALWNSLHTAGCVDDHGRIQSLQSIRTVLESENYDPQLLVARLPTQLLPPPVISDGRDGEGKPRTYRISRSHYQQFREFWELLHRKVIYEVKHSADFERKAVEAINAVSGITPLRVHRDTTTLGAQDGEFIPTAEQQSTYAAATTLTSDMSAREFINRLAEKTNLPCNTIIRILYEVDDTQYRAMQSNPYLAVQEVASAINRVIHQNAVDDIRYHGVDGLREPWCEITLTDREFEAKHYITLDGLPRYENNNLWEEIAPYDSEDPEKRVSENALAEKSITVFAKLPRAVKIPAPMHPNGINPDFACIVRGKNGDRRFYFVAEAKPTTAEAELRLEEQQRIHFMRRYFDGIGGDIPVHFGIISNYDQLLAMFNGEGETK